MKTIEQISEGTFRVTTTYTYTGGAKIGQTYELTDIVYSTNELAGEAASKKRESWGSNLVILGNEEIKVNGTTYYAPSYNVFD